MTEKKESGMPIGFTIIFVLVISLFIACSSLATYDYITDENIVVEGKIISTEYLETIDAGIFGSRDVLRVTFDNNESYDLVLGDRDYDFTVNSKLILKLNNYDDDRWSVTKIIKVPDVEEG